MDIVYWIKEYLKQCNTNETKYSKYDQIFSDLEVKARFGSGQGAYAKCMGFFGGGHEFTNGYYPTFLFYVKEQFLFLSSIHRVKPI